MTDNPHLTPMRKPEDIHAAFRPKSLTEFIGQQAARENLRVFIEAARSRGDALDHVLFFGPPGLGKTTLAQIVAREMGVGFRATSGPVIAKSGEDQVVPGIADDLVGLRIPRASEMSHASQRQIFDIRPQSEADRRLHAIDARI